MDIKSVDRFIDGQKENMTEVLKDFIAIPSVKSEPEDGKPYGDGIFRALEFISDKAKEMGFKTQNFENKIRIAEYGRGDEKLGILCHTDVVSVNEDKWATPPFEAAVKDNLIYGRGSLDNKGPTVAALFAVYALKECGIDLKDKVQIFFGSDEESGMHDFKDYLKVNTLPEYAFAPDCCFPVAYSETGKFNIEGKTQLNSENVISLHSGGTFSNVTPETAVAKIKNISAKEIGEKLDEIKDVTYKIEPMTDYLEITVFGKSTHTAHPHWGVNPLTALLEALSQFEAKDSAFKRLSALYPHGTFFGENLGLKSNENALSLVSLNYDGETLEFVSDCRVNAKNRSADIAKIILDKFTVPAKAVSLTEPHYVPKDSYLVKELCAVYKEFTGREDEPYAADGATYAHVKDGAVAFGGVLYGDGGDGAHGNNECYSLDTLVSAAKMFARAILRICKEA